MGEEIATCFIAGILLLLQSSLLCLFIRGDFPNEHPVEVGGRMGYCDLCQAKMGQSSLKVSRASLAAVVEPASAEGHSSASQMTSPGQPSSPASRQTFTVTFPASCPAQLTQSPSPRCVAVHKSPPHLKIWSREKGPQKIQFKWTEAVYEKWTSKV